MLCQFLDSLSQVYLGMASPTAVDKLGMECRLHQGRHNRH